MKRSNEGGWDIVVDAGAGFSLDYDEVHKNVALTFVDRLKIAYAGEGTWETFRKLVEVTEIADATFRAEGRYDLPVGYKQAVRFSTEDQWTEFRDAVLGFVVPDV